MWLDQLLPLMSSKVRLRDWIYGVCLFYTAAKRKQGTMIVFLTFGRMFSGSKEKMNKVIFGVEQVRQAVLL